MTRKEHKLKENNINGTCHSEGSWWLNAKHNSMHHCRRCVEGRFNWWCLCLKWTRHEKVPCKNTSKHTKFKGNGYYVTGTLSHGESHVPSETTRVMNKFNSWFQNWMVCGKSEHRSVVFLKGQNIVLTDTEHSVKEDLTTVMQHKAGSVGGNVQWFPCVFTTYTHRSNIKVMSKLVFT